MSCFYYALMWVRDFKRGFIRLVFVGTTISLKLC